MEEYKLKSILTRTTCAVLICLFFIILNTDPSFCERDRARLFFFCDLNATRLYKRKSAPIPQKKAPFAYCSCLPTNMRGRRRRNQQSQANGAYSRENGRGASWRRFWASASARFPSLCRSYCFRQAAKINAPPPFVRLLCQPFFPPFLSVEHPSLPRNLPTL